MKALVDYFDEKIHNALATADRQPYQIELSAIDAQNSSKVDGLLNQSSQNVIHDLNQS